MAPKQSLCSWILEAITDQDKDGPCVALSLSHVSGGIEKEIHSVKFGNRQWTEQELEKLFMGKAKGYAQELPGVQYFIMHALYEKSSEPQAHHPFRVNGELEFGDLATEAADDRGMRQQDMRQREAIVQGSFRMVSVAFENQQAMMAMMQRMVLDTNKENREMFQALQEHILKKAQDDHAYRLEELKVQRTNELLSKGASLVPSVVNKLVGKEVFPESAVDKGIIDMVVKDLLGDPSKAQEKLAGLQSLLSPGTAAAITTRINDILQSHVAEKRLAERVTKNPEDDAAGS